MAVSSRLMIIEPERRFPVLVKLAVVPPMGFGERLNRMHAWLDDNCGADGWEITPAGLRGVTSGTTSLSSASQRGRIRRRSRAHRGLSRGQLCCAMSRSTVRLSCSKSVTSVS